jgi:hypothetical protein
MRFRSQFFLLHPEQNFVDDNRRLALHLQLGEQVIKLR